MSCHTISFKCYKIFCNLKHDVMHHSVILILWEFNYRYLKPNDGSFSSLSLCGTYWHTPSLWCHHIIWLTPILYTCYHQVMHHDFIWRIFAFNVISQTTYQESSSSLSSGFGPFFWVEVSIPSCHCWLFMNTHVTIQSSNNSGIEVLHIWIEKKKLYCTHTPIFTTHTM